MHIIPNYIPEKGKSVNQKMKAENILGDDNESAVFDIKVQNVTEGMLPCYARTLKRITI